ncbi:glutathione peroxidase [Kaarinaea lacus]
MSDSFAVSQQACPETRNYSIRTLAGNDTVNLSKKYIGNMMIVVNTASKCGYAYQYEGLEALYRKYRDKGFIVLGFPSNDFGRQEPGSEKQIQDFCRLTYGVDFPTFEKTYVARHSAGPVYKTLARISGEYPQWNFNKYMLNRNGKLVKSFNSKVEPQGRKMISVVERLL